MLLEGKVGIGGCGRSHISINFTSKTFAIVDLPEPDKPVIKMVKRREDKSIAASAREMKIAESFCFAY
ncbi:MAG: hypothetical protein VR65_22500 [Desulfobulbaceae bacterium BRH_c16a]|nr:MAG: hypothetical protein VR65_22500 [Desulfobulbaceae bacterium BRH_c16a]